MSRLPVTSTADARAAGAGGTRGEGADLRQPGGVDVRPGKQRRNLAPDDPRVPGPPHCGDREQHVCSKLGPARQPRRMASTDRQGQEQIGDPHQQGVDDAAGDRRRRSDDRADNDPAADDESADTQVERIQLQGAGEQVAAEVVSAEQRARDRVFAKRADVDRWVVECGASTGRRWK